MSTYGSPGPRYMTGAETAKVIAVPGMTADTVGAVVFWRLSGDVRRSELELLWLAEGLDPQDLPVPTSPASALARAVREQASRSLFPRPIGRGDGWALVQERPGEEVPDYTVKLRVVLTDTGPQVQAQSMTGGWLPVDEDDSLAQEVTRSYNDHLTTLSGSDFSSWLVKRAEALKAVRLRDTGGIYFVPRDSVPQWQKTVSVVRHCTEHVVSEIPALRSDEAVGAVMEAIIREAGEVMTQIEADLRNSELGSRALDARVETVCRTMTKVEGYGDLLGRSMADVTSRLDDLRAQAVEASMVAQAKAEAEREARK